MNERIKELAEQAGDDWEHTLPSDREFLEKFAELIVQECAEFVEQDQGNGEILSNRLKQHFGVEE